MTELLTCKKCGANGSPEDFPPRNRSTCTKCDNVRKAEWKRRNPEAQRQAARRWEARNRERVWAQERLRYAVWSGRLSRPDECQECGSEAGKRALDGHHDDYSKPFDVRWLCAACHRHLHRELAVSEKGRDG